MDITEDIFGNLDNEKSNLAERLLAERLADLARENGLSTTESIHLDFDIHQAADAATKINEARVRELADEMLTQDGIS